MAGRMAECARRRPRMHTQATRAPTGPACFLPQRRISASAAAAAAAGAFAGAAASAIPYLRLLLRPRQQLPARLAACHPRALCAAEPLSCAVLRAPSLACGEACWQARNPTLRAPCGRRREQARTHWRRAGYCPPASPGPGSLGWMRRIGLPPPCPSKSEGRVSGRSAARACLPTTSPCVFRAEVAPYRLSPEETPPATTCLACAVADSRSHATNTLRGVLRPRWGHHVQAQRS